MTPGASVVTPSRDNPDAVVRFLGAVTEAARHTGSPVEVLVVDDSTAGPAARIEEACAGSGARYLRGPRRVGAKRNVGARNAAHDVIIFIDSDCVPGPGLIEAHLRVYRTAAGRVGAVAGPVTAVPGGFAAEVEAFAHDANAAFGWGGRYQRLGWAPTANLSVTAKAFWEIGGFDEETVTVTGGEDVDLGLRLNSAGWAMLGAPDAVAAHGSEPEPAARLLRKAARYGRADTYLRIRHPHRRARRMNRATLAAGIALSGAVAGLARPRSGAALAGAGALALLGFELARRPSRVTPATLPAALTATMIDIGFDAGALAEALRQRRPALALGRFAYQVPGEFDERCSVGD